MEFLAKCIIWTYGNPVHHVRQVNQSLDHVELHEHTLNLQISTNSFLSLYLRGYCLEEVKPLCYVL